MKIRINFRNLRLFIGLFILLWLIVIYSTGQSAYLGEKIAVAILRPIEIARYASSFLNEKKTLHDLQDAIRENQVVLKLFDKEIPEELSGKIFRYILQAKFEASLREDAYCPLHASCSFPSNPYPLWSISGPILYLNYEIGDKKGKLDLLLTTSVKSGLILEYHKRIKCPNPNPRFRDHTYDNVKTDCYYSSENLAELLPEVERNCIPILIKVLKDLNPQNEGWDQLRDRGLAIAYVGSQIAQTRYMLNSFTGQDFVFDWMKWEDWWRENKANFMMTSASKGNF